MGMWCVPPALRPLGISLKTIFIHVLGSVPSQPLLGLLYAERANGKTPEEAGYQWRVVFGIWSLLLPLSATVFMVAAGIASPAADFRSSSDSQGGSSPLKKCSDREGSKEEESEALLQQQQVR